MKWIKYYTLLMIVFVVQSVFGDNLKIFGVIPDLIFVLAVCVSLKEKRLSALVFSLTAGLLKDFALMTTFGLNALIMIYMILIVSCVVEKYFYPNIIVNFVSSFLATVIYQTVYLFFGFVMWGKGDFISSFLYIILPLSFYNGLVSFVMFFVVSKLLKEKIFVTLKVFRRDSK